MTGQLGFGREAAWRFGEGGDKGGSKKRPHRPYVEDRACDGWPELGSCGRPSQSGGSYCAECDEARRAHQGTESEGDSDD